MKIKMQAQSIAQSATSSHSESVFDIKLNRPTDDQDSAEVIFFIDGFCGGGGASEGMKLAGEIKDEDGNVIANTIKVAIAINHNERAIWAHSQNHPETEHLNDDIRKVDISEMARMLKAKGIRRVNIWWSAECTHFSNAKGGASRDADSRMLSEELLRYIMQLEANGIEVTGVCIENVREFFTWTALLPKSKAGKHLRKQERRYVRIQLEIFDAVAAGDFDLKKILESEMDAVYLEFQRSGFYQSDEDGKLTMLPDSSTKGQLYLRWVDAIKDLGYRYDWKMMNAADYGAYQSRDRYFGIFIKDWICKEIEAMGEAPIKFPNPTHSKKPKAGSLFEAGSLPWKPCREILDLSDKGESIFYGRKVKTGRRKGDPMPLLVPATLARIAYGIMKFKGEGTLIDRSNSDASPTGPNEPMPTVRASYQNVLVNVATVDSCTFGQNEVSVNECLPTVMAKRDKYLMNAFVVPTSFTNQAQSINEPLPTLIAARKHQYLCAPFIVEQYGTSNARQINSAIGTVMTKDKFGLCHPFIAHQFSSDGKPNQVASINDPVWTITTFPKARLVIPFLSKYYGNGDNATSLAAPCGTITTKDRLGVAQCDFVSIYHGGAKSNRAVSVNEPLRTLTTENRGAITMTTIMPIDDNWPIILRHAPKPTKNGNVIVPAWSRVLNGYQVDNRIIDIHYRMLKVDELKLAQGFPKEYILDPTSETWSKYMIGNAVHVKCAEELVRVNFGPNSAFRKVLSKIPPKSLVV